MQSWLAQAVPALKKDVFVSRHSPPRTATLHANPQTRLQTRDPWSVPVQVTQIPVTGQHMVIEPTPEQSAAIAAAGGVRQVEKLRAAFTLTPSRGDQMRVEGRLTGRVGQTCVVTLDPLDTDIDEPIDMLFAPAEHVRSLAATMDDTDGDAAERPDPPEPIENGVIDLGRIATDALFLGLDPYPRKPDAVFQPPAAPLDPEDHPFAALKALKTDL